MLRNKFLISTSSILLPHTMKILSPPSENAQATKAKRENGHKKTNNKVELQLR